MSQLKYDSNYVLNPIFLSFLPDQHKR